jgi:putative ATP-binding cassette transporter
MAHTPTPPVPPSPPEDLPPSRAAATATPAPTPPKSPTAWQLIRPYWVSEKRWEGRRLLLLVLALNLAVVFINVRLNAWNQRFYDALDKRNWPVFTSSLMEFAVLAFSFIIIATFRTYFRQMLEIKWRQWVTDTNLTKWFTRQAYYRIERDHLADNPDQRISEDIRTLVSSSLALSLDLLTTLVSLFSFVTILWTLSGAVSFALGTMNVTIPGDMVWVAALYAVVGSFFIFKVGRPLVGLSYRQQQVEADFRFLLVRLRESAEQVALYRGEGAELSRLKSAFGAVRDNWWQIMVVTKRLIFANSIYGQIAIVFPIMAASPRYFAGAFTLGVLMRIIDTFGQVSDGFSWFVNSFTTLADWKATINRLREFTRVIDEPPRAGGIAVVPANDGAAPAYTATDLQLALPNGTPLADVGSFAFARGSRWLVRGRSKPRSRSHRLQRLSPTSNAATHSPPSISGSTATICKRSRIGHDASLAANNNASLPHARSCKSPTSSSSTKPQARSMSKRKKPCTTRFTPTSPTPPWLASLTARRSAASINTP